VLMGARDAPRGPSSSASPRRAGSLRRTSTIDTDWPEGQGRSMRMVGIARDIISRTAEGQPEIVAHDEICARVSDARLIQAISASRQQERIAELVGARGGGHLRAKIAQTLPQETADGTTLNLLLDDLSGASLVARWAWTRWPAAPAPMARGDVSKEEGSIGSMLGICAGFRPGSSALTVDGYPDSDIQSSTLVPSLVNPDDPSGWHYLRPQPGVGMRRARQLDIWYQESVVHIKAIFQDSATVPNSEDRCAIHEYCVRATMDPSSMELVAIRSFSRISNVARQRPMLI
jgi:hypothetical protein